MRVTVDVGGLDARIDAMARRGLWAASEQALTDNNFYIPARDWFLRNSSEGASDTEHGHLVWATPYARRRHYEPANVSRDVNPNATRLWTQVAKRNHLQDWAKAAEKAMEGK
jgi:hypothetical protein